MKLFCFVVEKCLEKQKTELHPKGWNMVDKNVNRILRMTLDGLSYALSSPPARQKLLPERHRGGGL